MDYRRMRIGSVRPCGCAKHHWLVLHEHGGGVRVGLRVHAGHGRWLGGDGDGDAVTRLVRGVAGLLRGAGREPRAVIVSHDERRRVRLSLRVGGADGGGGTDLECEPGVALLAAQRLGLPILLRRGRGPAADGGAPDEGGGARGGRPPPAGIPEVYRETLAALGLLGDDAPG